jgi:hypothetical protein
MSNTDDSIDGKDQAATAPMDYSALLAMTRPLVVTKPVPHSVPNRIHEDKAVSLKASDWWLEFALKKGQIVYSEVPLGARQDAECSATTSALPQGGSTLRMRIHLGMS